ncbi:sensor histidine kinase [Arthrobacter sp. Ld5]|uniref:sensor histidine kinase n=1 Tax=Arthrobacter sp. Ld5 TaxID=649152 RepID=UPI003EBC1475
METAPRRLTVTPSGTPEGIRALVEAFGATSEDIHLDTVLERVASAAAVAIANSRPIDNSARRTRWLQGGLDAVREILGQTGPTHSHPASLAHHALLASRSDITLVLREIGDGRRLLCAAAGGPQASSFVGESWGCPTRLKDLTVTSPPLLLTPGEIARLLPGASFTAPTTALCVRLAGSRERQYLLFGRRADAPFTDVDQAMVRTFTSHVSLALQLLCAQRQRELDAVFSDRDRIARDLHDLVIQRLFATGLSIQVLRKHLPDPEALDRLGVVTTELDATIRTLRDTIHSLRSAPRVAPAFSARVFALVAAVAESHTIQPVLHLSGPLDASVDPGLADHVHGVIREGLSNALRHAAANSITITLQALPDHLGMEIVDDGAGFVEPSSCPGLTEMRRHAELCDGALAISSALGRGTHIRLSVPLDARGAVRQGTGSRRHLR